MKKIIFIVALILTSCSPSQPQAPALSAEDIQSTAVALAWTSVVQTQIAGATATPTNTPLPTSTPIPTATSTPQPQPITLTGTGDSIVDVAKWNGAAIMHARYASGGNFIVTNYAANNERLDLLVNTIGAYDGTVLLDVKDLEQTTRLEIKASGPWELLISPLISAKIFQIPSVVTGTGDDVILLNGGNADIIKADNSQGDGNFIVIGYSRSSGKELVFNEISPYTGTALLAADTVILTITATGYWSLDISKK